MKIITVIIKIFLSKYINEISDCKCRTYEDIYNINIKIYKYTRPFHLAFILSLMDRKKKCFISE